MLSTRWAQQQRRRLPPAAGIALALLLVAAIAPTPAAAWSYGRATHYGHGDGMNINHGSCMFGSLDTNLIAALSDADPEYAGSCGACYEVECAPGSVTDGYGEKLDRDGACKPGSVVVKVTDTCPCNYPANAYSNKRWCCGDQRHLDLSFWAFERIADPSKGVVGVRFRRVACGSTGSSGGSSSGGGGASGGSASSNGTSPSPSPAASGSSSTSSPSPAPSSPSPAPGASGAQFGR